MREIKTTYHNKKHIIVDISLLITEFTAHNKEVESRQDSDPQLATTYFSKP